VDKLNHFSLKSTGSVPQVYFFCLPASLATALAFGQCGYVTDTNKVKDKLSPRAHAVRYTSRVGASMYRVYFLESTAVGVCRVANFKPYNPAQDPTVVMPVPVSELPLNLQEKTVSIAPEAETPASAPAADASIEKPLPDISQPPRAHPAITAYELEKLRSPDYDGHHAAKAAAHLAEQHTNLSPDPKNMREAMSGRTQRSGPRRMTKSSTVSLPEARSSPCCKMMFHQLQHYSAVSQCYAPS
jgi:hypothetical protein